jgi:hypothetical protein
VLTLPNRAGYNQNTKNHRTEPKTTWLQLSQRLESPRTMTVIAWTLFLRRFSSKEPLGPKMPMTAPRPVVSSGTDRAMPTRCSTSWDKTNHISETDMAACQKPSPVDGNHKSVHYECTQRPPKEAPYWWRKCHRYTKINKEAWKMHLYYATRAQCQLRVEKTHIKPMRMVNSSPKSVCSRSTIWLWKYEVVPLLFKTNHKL